MKKVVQVFLHYESDGDSFVLPNGVNDNSNVLGKTKESFFSLPQRKINENQVFD